MSAWILSVVMIFCVTSMSTAGEKATKDECIAKVKQASQLIKKIGLDKALKKISSKDGGFQ